MVLAREVQICKVTLTGSTRFRKHQSVLIQLSEGRGAQNVRLGSVLLSLAVMLSPLAVGEALSAFDDLTVEKPVRALNPSFMTHYPIGLKK